MKRILIVAATILLLSTNAEAQKKSRRHRSKAEVKRINEHKSARRSASFNQEPAGGLVLRSGSNAGQMGPPPQNPPVIDALDILRGRPPLTAKEAYDVLSYAQGGKDFPVYLEVPKTYFTCGNAKPGFYADLDTYCQAYHRCDIGGKQSTFLCPTKTLFNQITLVCDWFYNVNCQNSRQFIEYSNSRLYYPTWQVLDTQEHYVLPYTSVQLNPVQSVPQPHPQQPPPVLYPGKQPMADQIYGSGNINGHESPQYQMSVVIPSPQYVPDYNTGESSLVHKELYFDQGATMPPAMAVETRVDFSKSASEPVREHPWRQFRQEQDKKTRPAAQPNVNVTVTVADSQPVNKATSRSTTQIEQAL